MKHRLFGIYGKVFFYTLAILLFAFCITVFFFANQIGSIVERTQQEQLAGIFAPLSEALKGRSDEEAAQIAADFHAKNTSFDFSLSSKDGRILYQTDSFVPFQVSENTLIANGFFSQDNDAPFRERFYRYAISGNANNRLQLVMATDSGGRLYVTGLLSGSEIYIEYLEKTAIALGLILLASTVGAALFARRIAGPIRVIAGDTKRMTELQPVSPPKIRKDEIGELAADVFTMYQTLNSTIDQLEIEIKREREMEENQRYFFSAASHELKTPIAAMSALVEEMLEGMVDAECYNENLNKCMKMLVAQKKLVSEILELIRLSGDSIEVNRQHIQLSEVIDAILPMAQPLSETKKLNLIVEIPEEFTCHSDERMLERVLSNVIMNAVQNASEYGDVRIWAENSEENILFLVSNVGEQIDDEVMSRLFEPFFRQDQARSRVSGHSGLGLTIVKRVLNRLEIPFSLENTDTGILFWMRLPKE